MNEITVLVFGVVLALLLGAAAGAAAAAGFLRRRIAGLQENLEGAAARLSETGAMLAAATAENQLLREQSRQLQARSGEDASVLKALAPVAEKLSQVQSQVGLLERDRVEQFGQLAQQLQEARLADAQLLSTTQALAAALRSNSARGQWGEVQLRRVVEAAGMLPRVDFLEQVTLAGGDASGLRPDLVVSLPGNKQLVVDAKVPLAAFLEAQEAAASADGAGQRSAMLRRHAKSLRAHVDALSGKKYWNGAANTPELVVCFIPAESILSAALQADPELLDYAFSRNVALASPVSLLAILKGVAFSWRQEVLTENARELFDLSRELYERLGTMGGHITKLGSSLKSSVEKYNSFLGALESRVLPAARRINAFDAAALDARQGSAQPDNGSQAGTGDESGPPGRSTDDDSPLRIVPLEAVPRATAAHELLQPAAEA
jgi:DNA recombination protein RmuC